MTSVSEISIPVIPEIPIKSKKSDQSDQSNLKSLQLKDLKKLCKIMKLKPIKQSQPNQPNQQTQQNQPKSKLTAKPAIINLILTYISCIKIQRFFRKKMAVEQVCPITMDFPTYPCFAYMPKGHTRFIYYNLESLANYLLTTGDFRDPKTREEFPEETIIKMDKEIKKNKIAIKNPHKSMLKASKNKKYYRNKKDTENSILFLERCLDDIIGSMRSLLEQKIRRGNPLQVLNTILFMSFKEYYRRLVQLSPDASTNLIRRTIILINNCVERSRITVGLEGPEQPERIQTPISDDTNQIRDNIIAFLYQIEFEEGP